MQNFDLENIDCHATLAMIEKRWGFPRCTLRALLGMTKSGQSGRSMIEMLGVLAIIGVLSVGGIAGYSKAMMKYRINKTIEQISLIANNINTFFAQQKNFTSLNCSCSAGECYDAKGCSIIKKAKLVPEEMLTFDNSGKITAITNAFGGELLIERSGGQYKAYGMALRDLPAEACIDIATQDWNSVTASGYTAMSINNTEKSDAMRKNNIWDMTDYLISGGCSHSVSDTISLACGNNNSFSIDEAATACACKADKCAIGLVFKK